MKTECLPLFSLRNYLSNWTVSVLRFLQNRRRARPRKKRKIITSSSCAAHYLDFTSAVPPWNSAHTFASIPIEIRPKQLRAEMTQGWNDPGLKRLTYLGRNDPPKKLAETTQDRNDLDSFNGAHLVCELKMCNKDWSGYTNLLCELKLCNKGWSGYTNIKRKKKSTHFPHPPLQWKDFFQTQFSTRLCIRERT